MGVEYARMAAGLTLRVVCVPMRLCLCVAPGYASHRLLHSASVVVKRGGWFLLWSCVVLFLSCVCVCDLFLFDILCSIHRWAMFCF